MKKLFSGYTTTPMTHEDAHREAVKLLTAAEAFIVAAGAGMGVDSGLPDFRGAQGFWKAYPMFEAVGRDFADIARPQTFVDEPDLAWGFYGHRLKLYQEAQPHEGYNILRRWMAAAPLGGFVYTSNVDGAFFRAGFERVVEVHGSIHHVQCDNCQVVLPMPPPKFTVDPQTMRAQGELPRCGCGALLRPNILMFNDVNYNPIREIDQNERFQAWLEALAGRRLLIIECGAGTSIPAVRWFSERHHRAHAGLIRINPTDPQGPGLGIAQGALEALQGIDQTRLSLV